MLPKYKLARMDKINELLTLIHNSNPQYFKLDNSVAHFTETTAAVAFPIILNLSEHEKKFLKEAKDFILSSKDLSNPNNVSLFLPEWDKEPKISIIRAFAISIQFISEQPYCSERGFSTGDIYYEVFQGYTSFTDYCQINKVELVKVEVFSYCHKITRSLLHYPYFETSTLYMPNSYLHVYKDSNGIVRKYVNKEHSIHRDTNLLDSSDSWLDLLVEKKPYYNYHSLIQDITTRISRISTKYHTEVCITALAEEIFNEPNPIIMEYLLKIVFEKVLLSTTQGLQNLQELYDALIHQLNAKLKTQEEQANYRIIPESFAWGYLLTIGIDSILKGNRIPYPQNKRQPKHEQSIDKVVDDVKHKVIYLLSDILSTVEYRDNALQHPLSNIEISEIIDTCLKYTNIALIEKSRKFKLKKCSFANKITILNINTWVIPYLSYHGNFNSIICCKSGEKHDITKNLFHEVGHYIHYALTGDFMRMPPGYGANSKAFEASTSFLKGELIADQYAYILLKLLNKDPFVEESFKLIRDHVDAIEMYEKDVLYFIENKLVHP